MGAIRIVGFRVRIKTNPRQYAVEFKTADKRRFEKRLFDENGGILASEGVRIENRIMMINEEEVTKARVYAAVGLLSNELGENGEFMKSRLNFEKTMNEYIAWHLNNRSNPKIEGQARHSIMEFGEKNLSMISYNDVQEWVDRMAEHYGNNTIKNIVAVPKAMYNRLMKMGKHTGMNPFVGHEWRPKRDSGIYIKPTVSRDEFYSLLSLTKSPQLRQAIVIGYYTGIRPSEVYRVKESDFDHEALILKLFNHKKHKVFRLIAIPQSLSIWVLNNGLKPLNSKSVENMFSQLKIGHVEITGLCMASFRKNFASVMEKEGVSHEAIDAHEGRYQNTVIKKHYLRDPMRAVDLMRSHVEKVFDGELQKLHRIK